jgi:hypothetical protein
LLMVTSLKGEFNESYPDVYYDPDLNTCFSVDFFNKTAKIFFILLLILTNLKNNECHLQNQLQNMQKKDLRKTQRVLLVNNCDNFL